MILPCDRDDRAMRERRATVHAYETLESMLMRCPESHERQHCLNELDGIHAYLTSPPAKETPHG